MKPLPTTYRDHGLEFALVKREGSVAMFKSTTRPHFHEWEIVIAQHNDPRLLPNGKMTTESESVPHYNSWGKKGWTAVSEEQAEAIFQKQAGKQRQKANFSDQDCLPCEEQRSGSITTAEEGAASV